MYIYIYVYAYDAGFLFKVWATGQWKIGECAIVFQFSVCMLSLSFLVSVLSFSNQKTCVTNSMSVLYTSPMTDKDHASYIYIYTYVYKYNYTHVPHMEITMPFDPPTLHK